MKRQHYVPQFLLRGFADDDEKLSVFTRGEGLSFRASPKDVACQRYYNAAKLESGEIDTQTIERELSQIEDSGSSAIRALLSGAKPTAEQREAFALFLTSQDFRSPRRRQEYADMLLGIEHHKFGRDTVKSVESFVLAVTQASERSDELDVTKLSDKSELRVEADGTISMSIEATIWSLSAAKHFAPVVSEMNWHLFRAPRGKSFITSDSPVQLYESPETLEKFNGPAYWRQGSYISFPLTSDACFLASHRSRSNGVTLPPHFSVREAKSSDVHFFNQLQLAGCLNQIYATSDYSWLHKKCADLPKRKSNLSFMPVNADGSRISVVAKR
ncbi:DUF4238 domain-containing protein [Pseudorhodobacter sp. MZDSW-24AT]|uniref:DUF4238 domain-containing protein n=1 Tax=Pseudorhodobacter sp. MZDSW-24AT TaxID=2052957 RepID=UPI001E5EFB59|nr:DUF4238 domain-containing protein [Pseudorhodobacter sp. MZDSW-24AT]